MRSAGYEDNQLGITLNLLRYGAEARDEADAEAARRVDGNANRLYLDPSSAGATPRTCWGTTRA